MHFVSAGLVRDRIETERYRDLGPKRLRESLVSSVDAVAENLNLPCRTIGVPELTFAQLDREQGVAAIVPCAAELGIWARKRTQPETASAIRHMHVQYRVLASKYSRCPFVLAAAALGAPSCYPADSGRSSAKDHDAWSAAWLMRLASAFSF